MLVGWVPACAGTTAWRHRLANWVLLVALLTSAWAARADSLPDPVAQALAAAGIPDSHVGIVVQDLDSGAPLLTYGERRSFNPASVSSTRVLTTRIHCRIMPKPTSPIAQPIRN